MYFFSMTLYRFLRVNFFKSDIWKNFLINYDIRVRAYQVLNKIVLFDFRSIELHHGKRNLKKDRFEWNLFRKTIYKNVHPGISRARDNFSSSPHMYLFVCKMSQVTRSGFAYISLKIILSFHRSYFHSGIRGCEWWPCVRQKGTWKTSEFPFCREKRISSTLKPAAANYALLTCELFFLSLCLLFLLRALAANPTH